MIMNIRNMINCVKMDRYSSCLCVDISSIYRIFIPTVFYLSLIWLTLSSAAQDNGAENGGSKNTKSLVTLQNNGYKNLVIGINERVPEDPNLIERIKTIFTDTSRFLYSATNQRAYFEDIRILIPESWKASGEYKPVLNERYDISDVRVDLPGANYGDLPYTNKPTPCGVPGLYMHLTPNYLTDVNVAARYGPYDKVLVHEWGHYRWGVFDEYPLPGMSHFYAASNGDIEAVRCVLAIPGVPSTESGASCTYNNNGLPDADCRFNDDRFADGYTGSLMYKQFLPQITTFCTADPIGPYRGNVHNREAPNRQNLLCDGRSIWEVLLEHEDFKDNRNPSRDMDDPVPTFTLVKKTSTRLVLVLDTSGSMEGERLRQLRQAASNLITNILRDGEMLGIVLFSEEASTSAELTIIADDTRLELLDKLPTNAKGATSIGGGVYQGLNVLSRSGSGVAGSRMLVITDGEENTPPYIKRILKRVEESGVRIDTIAIGAEASRDLEILAATTGGRSYYHTNDSNTLNEAFGELTRANQEDSREIAVDLYSQIVIVAAATKADDKFMIDSNIGRNTQLSFGYSLDEGIDVILTSPSGITIDKQSDEYVDDNRFDSLQIKLAENAETGFWRFEITNLADEEQRVTVSVQSQSRDGDEPIITNARWGSDNVLPPEKQRLYVTVSKGYTPIIQGDVQAIVGTPSGDVALQLRDDGVGADIASNDGIYSTFFTQFSGIGRYSVQVNVQSQTGGTFIASGSIVGVGALVDPEFETVNPSDIQHVSTGTFQRITNGGSFTCNSPDECSGSKDVYAPSKITDLLSDSVRIGKRTVEITFTAPGDDLTSGQASRYEIRLSTNFTQLYDDFDSGDNITEQLVVEGDLFAPKMSGSKETFVIKVPKVGDFSYVFAVVAFDNEGNRSPRSNLATSTAKDYRKSSFQYVGLIVGLLFFLLFLILMCCIVYFIFYRRSKRTKDVENSKAKVGEATDEAVYDNQKPGYVSEIKVGIVSEGVASFDNIAYQNDKNKKKLGAGSPS